MSTVEAIFRVLVVGLLFGAGLPALFAVGMRAYAAGEGGVDADGVNQAPHPAMKIIGWVMFALVGLIIITAVLWIARASINYHLGINLFPFAPKK